MSEEEKKAKDRLEDLISISKVIADIDINKQVAFRDITTILNLNDKQQKEIEDYKKFKKDIEDNIREIIKDLDEFDDYFFNVSTLKEATKNSLNRLLEE